MCVPIYFLCEFVSMLKFLHLYYHLHNLRDVHKKKTKKSKIKIIKHSFFFFKQNSKNSETKVKKFNNERNLGIKSNNNNLGWIRNLLALSQILNHHITFIPLHIYHILSTFHIYYTIYLTQFHYSFTQPYL
jgi:hypothetical protein